MNKAAAFFGGLGLGAGVMFILDPDRGKRRRALVRDKAVHLANSSVDVLGKTKRDIRNRVTGVIAETKAILIERDVPDAKLMDRVKSVLGRYPVHDRSINVEAVDGKVILTGDILASEVDETLEAVKCVRGVNEVVNNLTVHESAEGISSLQGQPAGARA